eukprot:m.12686 g.12686  ORF g.12686 m.12686 type:complete len:337 (-) comp5855_c0_seq1:179-1189(-)
MSYGRKDPPGRKVMQSLGTTVRKNKVGFFPQSSSDSDARPIHPPGLASPVSPSRPMAMQQPSGMAAKLPSSGDAPASPFDLASFPALGQPQPTASASPTQAYAPSGYSMQPDEFPSLNQAQAIRSPKSTTPRTPSDQPSTWRPAGSGDASSLRVEPQSPHLSTDGALYGMGGFMALFQSDSPQLKLLSSGVDPNSLNLDFSSRERLFTTFNSPWEAPQTKTPAYYTVTTAKPLPQRFDSLSLHSLFYMFYNMPQDSAQLMAAKYLYNKEWRYHRQLKVWLRAAEGSTPAQSRESEQGQYLIFDPTEWKVLRKALVLVYDQLEGKPESVVNQQHSHA